MIKEHLANPRIWHDVRSLAALSWVSSITLVWLLILDVVAADLHSAAAFLFFVGVAVIASSIARVNSGESDD